MSWIEDPGRETFGSFDMSELDIDQAFLNVSSTTKKPLWLYTLSTNCHTCPYQRAGNLSSSGTVQKVSTMYPMKYRLRTNGDSNLVPYNQEDNETFCDIGPLQMGEFGIYEIQAHDKRISQDSSACTFREINPPVNIYYPILIAIIFYFVLAILVSLYKILFRSRDSTGTSSTSASTTSTSSGQTPPEKSPNGNIIIQQQIHQSHLPCTNPAGGPALIPKANGLSASRTSIASHRSNLSHAPAHNTPNHGVISSSGSDYGCYGDGEGGFLARQEQYSSAGSTTAYPGVIVGNYDHGTTSPAGRRLSAQSTVSVNSTTVTTNTLTNNGSQQPLPNQPPQTPPPQPRQQLQRQRLQSLDTFRGICIVIMIFVNDGGAHYFWLEHAAWDGLYVADLVFPWFLWIMGVCIPVSIKSQRKRNTPRLKIFGKILLRSIKLIGLGLFLASVWGPVEIREFRLPGVLQRFGICYFVCSTLVLLYMNVNFKKPGAQNKFKAALQDVEIIWIGWVAILLIVMVHCLITFFLVVPGCPTGYLGPGGLHENAVWSSSCIGGAAGYVDRQIFTDKHIYNYPTANSFYAEGDNGKPYDPEGALGTLTSLLQVWLGVQTGVTMLVYPKASSRVKRWLAWSVILGAAGTLLCGGKETGGWIPINKNLWSLSFVLITCCFALILLSLLYFLIDIKKWWSGSPFYEPGMNSILLYVGHSVGHGCLPFHWRYGRMATHAIRLLESLWGTTLWVLVAIYCNYKKFFWVL